MMRKKLAILPMIMMFLALMCCQGKQNQQPSQANKTASYTQDILNRIEEVESKLCSPVKIEGTEPVFYSLANQMKLYNVPGVSIAVINNGKIEWAKGYGVREAGIDSPVDVNTTFQAASISKSVSALGALHLVQKGALDLDTNINDFLRTWKVPNNEFTRRKPVTLRYLLCHGAGVSGHSLGTFSRGEEIPTFLQILDGQPPSKTEPVRIISEPQTEFRYSGGGYLIALQAMIDVSGKPFPDIMEESVLRPVEMDRSSYSQALEHDSAANVASSHNGMGSVFEGYWQIMPNPAGGGLWTTPSDLCLFAIEVQKALRGQSSVISQELAEEMLTGQIGDYGLGLILQGEGENLTFSHGGGNRGYHSWYFAYARRGQGVAVMTNGDRGHYLYNEILRSVGIVYDWPELKPSVIKPVQLPVETLNRYSGRFLWNKALPADITIENNHLKMAGDDGRIFLFYPDSDNHFYDLYSGWELKFIFNEEKEVTEALMSIGAGNWLKGEKIDK